MCSNYGKLHIIDNLPELGDEVLAEEVVLLAPHLMSKMMGTTEAKDDDGPDHKSGPLCAR